jgi:hypothetical protein
MAIAQTAASGWSAGMTLVAIRVSRSAIVMRSGHSARV